MAPEERSITGSSRQKSISGNGRGPVPGSLAQKLTFAEVRAVGCWPGHHGLLHDGRPGKQVSQSACSHVDQEFTATHCNLCMSLLSRGHAGRQDAQGWSQRCPLLSLARNRWKSRKQGRL